MTTDLAIPGAVSETALDLPADMSFEDWQHAGEVLGRIGRACQWWIGDWLNFGERKYGEKYAQAMEVTGLAYDTLNSFRWVAQQIEPVRRRTNLSWSHHKEVAALEPAQQDSALEVAEAEGWSKAELRKQIKGAPSPEEDECCPTCGRRLPASVQIPPKERFR